jgi:hypothetical protein
MEMEQTECSETLAYKIQTPGNYPEENIQQVRCNLRHCVGNEPDKEKLALRG